MKKILVHILVIAVAVFCLGWPAGQTIAADVNSCEMTAHFINVGQADSTLLEFPCGAILIDAGVEKNKKPEHLIEYLNKFFNKRPELNRTLESVIITHGDSDHTKAMEEVCENFTVKRYVDNGLTRGDVPISLKSKDTIFRDVNNDEITAGDNKKGITDDIIDPINCKECDPNIVILWSRSTKLSGDYKKKNNQSLIIRVDFGKASFLFTGDAEIKETGDMLDYYEEGADESDEQSSSILDVDVYHVGHHGSVNGTTEELVDAMTPTIAVISVGKPTDAVTKNYGLPRIETLEMLKDNITETRNPSKKIKAAEGKGKFVNYKLKQNIYTTAADGDIKIQAKWDGSFTVTKKK